MPLTPEQIAKIRQKEAQTPDALKRNPLNDYTEGWFHVTLNTRGEAPVLGYIVGHPDAEDGSEEAPRCVLTELGKKVEESWNRNPSIYPGIENIEFQVMPEHVHGLVHLKAGNKKHLGEIIKGFMIGSTHGYWDTLGIAWQEMTYEKGVRTPQYNDRDHTRSYRGPALFVRGYNDVEAVTEEEIEIKRQYIRNNPRKRLITRSKPDRFRVVRNAHSKNWTLERALAAVAADPWIRRDAQKCQRLQANVSQRLKKTVSQHVQANVSQRLKKTVSQHVQANAKQDLQPTTSQGLKKAITPALNNNGGGNRDAPYVAHKEQETPHAPHKEQETPHVAHKELEALYAAQREQEVTLRLDYVGNRALLAAERKVSLICHRADAHLFEQQKAAVMQAAREGAVVVSAFVSPKERDIMKLLMLEQLPFIELMDNGFSERYKPGGKAFYSTAENRHVQMTCWTYKYQDDTLRHDEDAPSLRAPQSKPCSGQAHDENRTISREMCLVMNELARIISGMNDDWWKFTIPLTCP